MSEPKRRPILLSTTMPADLTILILTMNEEENLPKALASVKGLAKRVVVVDSGSTDRTMAIAREAGADVYENGWVNHATQVNWGLDNTDIDTAWTFRLDADEEVLPDLAAFLQNDLESMSGNIDGIEVRRRIYFLGRWIRHGGIYPNHVLRIFRNGRSRCEMTWMDEHMVVEGDVYRLNADLKDENTKPLRWWTAKHNWYSDRELFNLLESDQDGEADGVTPRFFGTQGERRRWLKTRVYARFPMSWRSRLYFLYRYYIQRGFLDGPEGRIFHFLQAHWYRFLVDAKYFEARKFPKIRKDLVEEVKQSLD